MLRPLPEGHALEREGTRCKQADVARLAAKRAEIDDGPGPFSQKISDVAKESPADAVDRDVDVQTLSGCPGAVLPAGSVRREDRQLGRKSGKFLRARFASNQPDDLHAPVGQKLAEKPPDSGSAAVSSTTTPGRAFGGTELCAVRIAVTAVAVLISNCAPISSGIKFWQRDHGASPSGRYIGRIEGVDGKAELIFTVRGPGLISADHTEAPASMRGTGAAMALVEHMIEDARANGFKIIPFCPSCSPSTGNILSGGTS